MLARTGPTEPVWRCPLIGVDRKWLAEGQNDAFDPTRTSRRVQLDIQVAVKRLKQAPETTLGFGQLNE
jgi:hypothetical protein